VLKLVYHSLSVVEVTQNWSFEVPKSGPDLDKSVADFECVSSLSIREFSAPDLVKSAPNFSKQHKTKTYFLDLYLFQCFRDAFTINIDLVSHVNLEREREREREGQKTRV